MDKDAPGYGMEPLATLPVFFKLRGATVLIAGGDAPAAWKAELLAAAGATVRVHAERPGVEMTELAARNDRVAILGRRWVAQDFGGVALAVGAIEDGAEAEAFRQAARSAGVPVNLVDKPAFCDFQFGTIVARSPLVIGISTDGAAPVFGQAIRARIEALLPQSLRSWAEAARAWRPAVQAKALDFRARRRFWEIFAERALAGAPDPSPADQAACFEGALAADMADQGRIWLVGSGHGTPGGLTLDALAALQSADHVVHDADVAPPTVGLARREASKTAVKEEASARADVLRLAGEGRRVAWLGTGSPSRCRRWGDRATALARSAIPITTVAGLRLCPQCPDDCQWPLTGPDARTADTPTAPAAGV